MPRYEENENPPWNFSWIVDGVLAGMACPSTEGNMKYVRSQGVKHLITLSPERPPALFAAPDIKFTEIGIEEFEAPSVEQIKQFIEICQECQSKNEPVGIHCRQGLGRTGVMGACFLVHFCDIPPQRAISNIRVMRPWSIETYEQERAVHQYHDYIRQTRGN